MAPNTGQVFRGQIEIDDARARGVEVVEIPEHVADALEIGMLALNAAERRRHGFATDRKRQPKRNSKRR